MQAPLSAPVNKKLEASGSASGNVGTGVVGGASVVAGASVVDGRVSVSSVVDDGRESRWWRRCRPSWSTSGVSVIGVVSTGAAATVVVTSAGLASGATVRLVTRT